jgi:inosine/xanthosine triphosphatase
MKILVGSKNPVKIEAVKEAFSLYYKNIEVIGLSVKSNVPDQPINSQTFEGAKNRALELQKVNSVGNLNADYFIGIEGGIQETYGKWFAFGGMCIIDTTGKTSFGTSAHFELPKSVTERLLNGEELGFVMDEIMNDENTKQKGGAISFFTNGRMNRKELYIPGIISALIPFLHKNLFFNSRNIN